MLESKSAFLGTTMKLKKRLQLFFLSLSIVSFLLLTIFLLVIGRENNEISAQESDSNDSLLINEQQVLFFIDLNNNQIKDTDETICEPCVSKQIILEIVTEIGKEMVVREINSDGGLDLQSTRIAALWGYSSTEKFLIPTFMFTTELDKRQIDIPVVLINYELVGENTNIGTIDYRNINEDNYEITFGYKNIVPVMETFVNSELPVWYIFYPNTLVTDKYYLSSGLVESLNDRTNSSNTYWHFLQEYSNIDNIDQYKLVIPKI